ncbi:MAG: glycosyltransferase [Acidimicrobiales bacterium]
MTDLSVIVPTRNETGNIVPLITRLAPVLARCGCGWEVIFADDSDDSTPDVVEQLAARSSENIVLLHRESSQRHGGLGGAVKCGFAKASGRVLVVMDGDLQHPPELVPLLAAPVLSGEADLVAGTRYEGAGNTSGLAGPWRQAVSISCRLLAHLLVPKSQPLSDPMSGFFALDRSVVDGVELRPDGYKILLEVAARGNWHHARNVGYHFDRRHSGQSKASLREGVVFLRYLWSLSRETGRLSRTPLGPRRMTL